MTELRTIHLPSDLCAEAEMRFGKQFGQLENLLTIVLQELLGNEATKLDRAEEQIIEERLRELGYI
jgi:hypothetical protein